MTINWKRTLIVVLDIIIGVYLILAVTAFNKHDDSKSVCTQVEVNINKAEINGFLDANEVTNILKSSNIYPLAQTLNTINIRDIEEILKKNPLIKDVECYKTIASKVIINVEQRLPVLRVMNDKGEDFYIDRECKIMPRTKYCTNLIVATGRISKDFAVKKLAPLTSKIISDDFWHNQVVQINVLPDESIEIVPRVGEHIICLGQPTDIDNKLQRVEKFYKYGLSKAGWNKYSYINVEFDNQIVCKKRIIKK